jgi:diaminopimelate decarboxylase
MDHFEFRNGQLYCEDVNVDALAARVGTPLYLYSKRTLEEHYARFSATFRGIRPQICYSIKNCGNIHLVKVLLDQGAGIDVVSGGELSRALEAGADPATIVFAGVGKTSKEIQQAFEAGVGWLNIESEAEFENARAIAAALKHRAKVAVRINPHVFDPETHQNCATGKVDSKFGVDIATVNDFFRTYGNDPWLQIRGLHIHLGSPIFSADTYADGIKRILALLPALGRAGHRIEMIDIGGGYVAHYDRREPSGWDHYAEAITPLLKDFVKAGGQVIMEPGRSIAANAGVLLARVQYIKHAATKKYIVVDAGMTHLMRPAMYDAYHFIWPTSVHAHLVPPDRKPDPRLEGLEKFDVVGAVCESSDHLGRDRFLPPVKRGDLIAVFSAGSYGMAMASQYNAIPRPPEVLVDAANATIIRRRETYDDLVALERSPERIVI